VRLKNGLVVAPGNSLDGAGGITTDADRNAVRISGDVPCLGSGSTISMAVLSDAPLPTIVTPSP
jgi:hypothetical protein